MVPGTSPGQNGGHDTCTDPLLNASCWYPHSSLAATEAQSTSTSGSWMCKRDASLLIQCMRQGRPPKVMMMGAANRPRATSVTLAPATVVIVKVSRTLACLAARTTPDVLSGVTVEMRSVTPYAADRTSPFARCSSTSDSSGHVVDSR